jgi:hypothetical protein
MAMGVGAPLVLETAADSGRGIAHYFHKRCHVATTAPTAAAADFTLTPNGKAWELKDRTGAIVFATSAWSEVNTAKDICEYRWNVLSPGDETYAGEMPDCGQSPTSMKVVFTLIYYFHYRL